MNLLLIFVGGGFGSVARYTMGKFISRLMGPDFPWGTLGVNLLGAVMIGALAEFLAMRISGVEQARLLLITGFLGGFTTFSAFSLENALMWQRGDYLSLACYIGASVIGGLIAVLAGGGAMRALL